jgi:hypothetical protein
MIFWKAEFEKVEPVEVTNETASSVVIENRIYRKTTSSCWYRPTREAAKLCMVDAVQTEVEKYESWLKQALKRLQAARGA